MLQRCEALKIVVTNRLVYINITFKNSLNFSGSFGLSRGPPQRGAVTCDEPLRRSAWDTTINETFIGKKSWLSPGENHAQLRPK